MPQFVQPTSWSLTAGTLQVQYDSAPPPASLTLTNLAGGTPPLVFGPAQIRTAHNADLGTVVSVLLQGQQNAAHTAFNLLLPLVNVPAPPAHAGVPVSCIAIVVTRLPPAPTLGPKQFDHPLLFQGIAS